MTLLKLVLLLIAGSIIVQPTNANLGVKTLNFGPTDGWCNIDIGAPCFGSPAILTVTQSDQSGSFQFDGLEGNGFTPYTVGVRARLGAECKANRKILTLVIDSRDSSPQIDGVNHPPVFEAGFFSHQFDGRPAGGERVPTQTLFVNVPIFPNPAESLFDGNGGFKSMMFAFDSPADVYAHGEAEVQARLNAGWTEEQARKIPFDRVLTHLFFSAYIGCKYENCCLNYAKRKHATIPIWIEFQSAPGDVSNLELPPPLSEEDRPDHLFFPAVTDVFLVAFLDSDDPCKLILSGTISTNGPMSVEFYVIKPDGSQSPKQSLSIDHTWVGMLAGSMTVPPAPSVGGFVNPGDEGGEIGGYTNPEGEGSGDPDGLVNENPDGFHGTYILETSWPNKVSYPAGYSVPFCSSDGGSTRTDETEPTFSFGLAETEDGSGGFLARNP